MADTPDKIRDDIVKAIRDQSLDIREFNNRAIAPVRYITRSITRPADTTAYAANDAFADSTSAPTVGGFRFVVAAASQPPPASVDVPTGGFVVNDGIFVASGATAYSGEIWLFDKAVTAVADNAAFTITDLEALSLVGVIPFATTDTTAANAVSYVTDIDVRFQCRPEDLRFLVKIMNTPTPASAEVLSVLLKYQPMRPL